MPATTPFTHPSRYLTYWREVQERIHVDIHPGTGSDTILFAHDLGCSLAFFESIDSSRELRGTTLARLNFHGHGDDERLWDEGDPMKLYPEPMEAFADQLADAYRELEGNGTVHIVSHGMGTVPALILHSRLLRDGVPFTGRFISIEGNLTSGDCDRVSREVAAVAGGSADFESSVDNPLRAFCDRLSSSRDRSERRWGIEMRLCDFEFLRHAAAGVVNWCDFERVAGLWLEVDNPVYIYGERTGYPEHNRHLLGSATTVEIPGSGHFPMLDNPYRLWPEISRAMSAVNHR